MANYLKPGYHKEALKRADKFDKLMKQIVAMDKKVEGALVHLCYGASEYTKAAESNASEGSDVYEGIDALENVDTALGDFDQALDDMIDCVKQMESALSHGGKAQAAVKKYFDTQMKIEEMKKQNAANSGFCLLALSGKYDGKYFAGKDKPWTSSLRDAKVYATFNAALKATAKFSDHVTVTRIRPASKKKTVTENSNTITAA